MPELPEVEVLRKFFEESAISKGIVNTEYYDDLDKVFRSSREKIGSNLIGNQFTETDRIGKYLFAKISNGRWLHLHFGMTGTLEIYNDNNSRPKFTRFAIIFEDGMRLAFRDMRKFGVVEIVDDLKSYLQENHIGKDLLKAEKKEFVEAFKGRDTPIKNALLGQNQIAGIGNWIADEMLFDCAIHPSTRCIQLNEKDLEALFDSSVDICKTAIKYDTHYGDFPDDFFVNYRKKGAIHPNHKDSPVEKLKVGGRGTFIVPEKQQLKK